MTANPNQTPEPVSQEAIDRLRVLVDNVLTPDAKPGDAEEYMTLLGNALPALLAAAEQTVKLRALLEAYEWSSFHMESGVCGSCGGRQSGRSKGHKPGCEWLELMGKPKR